MNVLLATIFLLMSASSIGQTSLDLSFNKEDFSISNGELITITTNLKERRVIGDTISPNLPYFPYRIKVPETTRAISLSVDYNKNLVAEDVRIAANPKPYIRNRRTSQTTGLRESTRSVKTPVINAGIKHQNGSSYLLLYVTPFLYDEPSGMLYFVSDIHIDFNGLPSGQRVSISTLPAILSTRQDADTFVNSLQPQADTDSIDYLIITSNNLKSSFTTLAQWKQRKCLRCKIITKEEIDTLYPQYNNPCARIKAFIMDYASPERKKWVLLGGDDSVIPSKTCSESSFPFLSDFYYTTDSVFSEIEWEADDDGLIANYDMESYNPYVYLSRLPVRTAQQVLDYTNKLIDYEMGVGVNNNLLLTGYFTKFRNGKSDSQILNEEIFDEFVSDYWIGSLSYIYDTETSFRNNNNDSIYISGEILKNAMDDCLFNIVHEISHGDSTYWQFGNDSINYYKTSHAQSQTNYPGSVIVTGACLTNQFEAEPCLSESLIRNPEGGAIAYFGSSGLGIGGEFFCSNASIYIPLMYSDQYDGHFLQNLYTGIPSDNPYSLAALATEAKSTVYNEFHATDSLNFYQYLLVSINTIGDPEMQVWTETPQSLSSNPYVVDPHVGVTLSGNVTIGTSVSGCTIAALDENGLRYVKKNTSSATFEGLRGYTNVLVSKHNYIPYLTTIYVDDWSGGGGGTQPFFIHATQNGDGTIDVSLAENADSSSAPDWNTSSSWTLKVVDTTTGEMKCTQMVEVGTTCRINITGWTRGVYGLQATIGGSSANVKINIR